jgi:lipopolysaccharide/colanic/teichoic acid biosynthesis glycosyltransferase
MLFLNAVYVRWLWLLVALAIVARRDAGDTVGKSLNHSGGLLAAVRAPSYALWTMRRSLAQPVSPSGRSGLNNMTLSAPGRPYMVVRRCVEVVLAGLGLALCAPLLALAALIIALDSDGPVLHWQERVGRNGRPFRLFKLRTMVADAEGDGRAVWAQRPDPRVTRVGGFLRRSRFDELPQLYNVLRGDMSLIGPRPERPEFVELLSSNIPGYCTRQVIRPGITGWAQVNYGYAASIDDAAIKLNYDLYYIRHQSPLLDIVILFKTLGVVLKFEGT